MNKHAAVLSLALIAGAASASTVQVQTGNYTDAANFTTGAAYKTAVDAAVTTSTWLTSADFITIAQSNYAVKATVTFAAPSAGDDWTFRAGVDLGKGGAIYLDGVLEEVVSNNMWWSYGYNDATQYFEFSANDLSAGGHTLIIYGVEDCCSGGDQIQYQVDGQSFVSFGANDGLPAVPESQSYAMLLAGLGLLATVARRQGRNNG